MPSLYLVGKVRSFDELEPRACVGFVPRKGESIRFVGDDGRPVQGLVGFVLAFESPDAARSFDNGAPIIELWSYGAPKEAE